MTTRARCADSAALRVRSAPVYVPESSAPVFAPDERTSDRRRPSAVSRPGRALCYHARPCKFRLRLRAARRADRALSGATSGAPAASAARQRTSSRIASSPNCRAAGAGDLLVFNDTRVIGRGSQRPRTPAVAPRCSSSGSPVNADGAGAHRASKSPKPGPSAELRGGRGGPRLGRDGELFSWTFRYRRADLLDSIGEVPLPPYLERDADAADDERYQTVYARSRVPSPRRRQGCTSTGDARRTLALAYDTPGSPCTSVPAPSRRCVANISRRTACTVSASRGAAQCQRRSSRRARQEGASSPSARRPCVRWSRVRGRRSRRSRARRILFIVPGFEFRSVDAMITNFHLPQSSLLMLVAALPAASASSTPTGTPCVSVTASSATVTPCS